MKKLASSLESYGNGNGDYPEGNTMTNTNLISGQSPVLLLLRAVML